jgi:nitrate/nitrite transporter NarK
MLGLMDLPKAQHRGGQWWTRVVSLLFAQSTQNFTIGALALLLPLIQQEIEMSFTEAGVLSVVLTLTYALGQVPAGYLGDRFGARRMMLLGLIGLNVLTVVVALAPTYLILAVVLFAIGGFRALAFAPGLALITSEFPRSRRATAMSLFMASGFASNLALSIIAPLFVDTLGWRGLIAVFGLASLIPVFCYAIAARSAPQERGAGSAPGLREFWDVLGEPIVWLASIVQFTRLGVTMGLRFWLPTYLVVDRGFDLATVALVVAVGSAMSILTTLLGGHVSDRRQQPIPVILVSLAALVVGLVMLTFVHDFVPILIVTASLYVFVQAYSGSLFEVPLRVLGASRAGTLNGFGNAWANVGGLVTTYLLGLSKDVTNSFDSGWFLIAALCAVAFGATLFMARILRGTEGAAGTAMKPDPR